MCNLIKYHLYNLIRGRVGCAKASLQPVCTDYWIYAYATAALPFLSTENEPLFPIESDDALATRMRIDGKDLIYYC